MITIVNRTPWPISPPHLLSQISYVSLCGSSKLVLFASVSIFLCLCLSFRLLWSRIGRIGRIRQLAPYRSKIQYTVLLQISQLIQNSHLCILYAYYGLFDEKIGGKVDIEKYLYQFIKGNCDNPQYQIIPHPIQQQIIQKLTALQKMPHFHNCYFHDQNTITHFCTKPECTLPMCDKCLPIHLQEHPPANRNNGIIDFGDAEEEAIAGLKKLLAGQSGIKTEYISRLEGIKGKLIRSIEQVCDKVRSQVQGECACVSEIEKKLTKIQKGSLKTLIYYYTQQQKTINKINLDTKLTYIEHIQKSLLSVLESYKNESLNHQQTVKAVSSQQVTFKEPQQNHLNHQKTSAFQTQEISSSSEINHLTNTNINRRTEIIRSSSQQRITSNQVSHKSYENEANLKLRTDASFKALPRYPQVVVKLESEAERQREIQNIRVREEQRQKQKQEKQRAEIQRINADRERERQMVKQTLRMQQLHQKAERQISRNTFQLTQWQRLQTRDLSTNTNMNTNTNISSNMNINMNEKKNEIAYLRVDNQRDRKPLQVSDLNIQTKYSEYGKAGQWKDIENRGPSEHITHINKEVLSPEEIRKMLEKRIEERSRLISKNKSVTVLKSTELSSSKNYARSKEITGNNYAQESEGRWDTKDSIINQIYDDYRY